MEKSKIEWTDATDNPIRTAAGSFYCFKVSEACDHCYAEVMARRISGFKGTTPVPYKKMRTPPELELRRDMLAAWARKTRPKKRFVTSMTDVAGEFVPATWFFEILDAMRAAPTQTFQLLTKRAARFEELCLGWLRTHNLDSLPPNIWPGCTVENERRAQERLPHLLNIPAYQHWISAEPLLGPIDLRPFLNSSGGHPALTWVVTGGESGAKARISHPAWFQDLRDQCFDHQVAFFFKQWGEWHPDTMPGLNARIAHVLLDGRIVTPPDLATRHAQTMYRIGKRNAGHVLDCHIWQDFPQARITPRPSLELAILNQKKKFY